MLNATAEGDGFAQAVHYMLNAFGYDDRSAAAWYEVEAQTWRARRADPLPYRSSSPGADGSA